MSANSAMSPSVAFLPGGADVAPRAAIERNGFIDEVPPTLREGVAFFERQLVAKAIQSQAGRKDAVAEELGIGRRTLNEKIVKLGIDKGDLL